MTEIKKKVVLIILDGWGLAPAWGGNAVEMAETPNMDKLWRDYPHAELRAAEEAVGLTRHEPGNSEVGHLNIGSGQIVYQNLPGISASIADGSFFKNKVLLSAIDNAQKNNSNLHLIGLVSDGGIHSYNKHLYALLDLAKKQNFSRVFIHMITDGRDTDPMKALSYLSELEDKIKEIGIGVVISVMGRYYAMDRDKHYDRIEKAYDVLTGLSDEKARSAEQAISKNYREARFDEFILPTMIENDNQPFVPIKDTDSVIFFNYRGDRSRQLTDAFTNTDDIKFKRQKLPQNLFFATFSFVDEYQKNPHVKTVFNLKEIKNPLAKIIADNSLTQLHIAETEKYAHVTYFFNGSHEEPYNLEERILISSPKVATFDLQPKMSAAEVAKALINNFSRFDFTVCNFANLDMVGHTGDIKATIKACETVDELLGKIIDIILRKNYVVLVTGDHGNAEEMINPKNNEPFTEHTNNPVPFILCTKDPNLQKPLRKATNNEVLCLSDIAPTILAIMGLKKPTEMTGKSLLV